MHARERISCLIPMQPTGNTLCYSAARFSPRPQVAIQIRHSNMAKLARFIFRFKAFLTLSAVRCQRSRVIHTRKGEKTCIDFWATIIADTERLIALRDNELPFKAKGNSLWAVYSSLNSLYHKICCDPSEISRTRASNHRLKLCMQPWPCTCIDDDVLVWHTPKLYTYSYTYTRAVQLYTAKACTLLVLLASLMMTCYLSVGSH